MNPLGWEVISALTEDVTHDGDVLHCVFKCPVSGELTRASAPLEVPQVGLLANMASRLASVLQSALGSPPPERAGITVNPDYSAEQGNLSKRQDAVLRAFMSCNPPFLWDGPAGRWVSSQAAGDLRSEFDRQLQDAPVTALEDRVAVARMLVAVAKIDGALQPDEWAFLNQFVSADVGSVDDFMREGAIAAGDLAGVPASPEVRASMLLLAWSMALSEGHIDEGEQRLIADYAAALGIPLERSAELRHWAEQFYVVGALATAYPSGVLNAAMQQEVAQLAAQLGLDPEQFARIESRYRMRNGIV